MTTNTPLSSDIADIADEAMDEGSPACVLVFNASDPSGAGGLTADISTIASVGGHPIAVVTGAYARDTAEIFAHFGFDDEAVTEQARAVLEDLPVQAIKVGFVGSPENISAIAEITTDYDEVPVIAYMPDLSWWSEHEIDNYLDAFRELLLPQVAVLVGNNTTLRHWLLPESTTDRRARATDLARAAGELGVSYVLVTGSPTVGDQLGNVLASAQGELFSQSYERIDAGFLGAGDILSAALTALIATGSELTEAVAEALQYLDQALDHGFRPGMGRAVADRLFWAESDDADSADDDAPPSFDIPHPFNETKH